jgi:hypothetical protein
VPRERITARWKSYREVDRRCYGRLDATVGKQSVWWGAVVRNVLNPTRPTAKRNATIRYDAMHGYEAADCNVLFISTSVLEAVEGAKTCVHHLWR